MAQTGSDRDLMAEEEQLWNELHGLIDTLPRDKVEEPGYFAEGWTAKDLIAHIGSWLAEAGAVLEQIRFGTYRPEEIDIDAMNKTFFDSLHDTAYPDVRAQAITARNRMLRAWGSLPEHSPEADRWIDKAGPEHYAEHLRGYGSGCGSSARRGRCPRAPQCEVRAPRKERSPIHRPGGAASSTAIASNRGAYFARFSVNRS